MPDRSLTTDHLYVLGACVAVLGLFFGELDWGGREWTEWTEWTGWTVDSGQWTVDGADRVDGVEESPGHFYWPDIDVDLTEDIIEHPERFPLTAKGTGTGRRP